VDQRLVPAFPISQSTYQGWLTRLFVVKSNRTIDAAEPVSIADPRSGSRAPIKLLLKYR
jgi:hypothetical protein